MAQYGTIQDLRDGGLPPEALKDIDGRELTKFLKRSGDLMDTYLRQKHTMPIVGELSSTVAPLGDNTYPGELIRCNVIIASYDLLVWRGFNPDQLDENWRERFDDCMSWLKMLAKGEVSLDETVDQTPTTNEGAPLVVSNGAGRVEAAPDGNTRGW